MSRKTNSLPPEYFDALYAANPDPWRFASSDYEQEKYGHTLKALARDRYSCALELGCSIGVLTTQLAKRCDSLLAVDAAEAALIQARDRCAAQDWVTFRRMRAPDEWPQGRFDLILLSEVVYYLEPTDVVRLAQQVKQSLMPAGELLLVHWTGETDYPLSGDDAAEQFIAAASGFAHVVKSERAEKFRLDLLGR